MARAESYAEHLDASINTYFASGNRIGLTGHFDGAASNFVFEARLIEPLPVEWNLHLSDMIHQLRAACDNIVYALIEHRGTREPGI